MSTAASGSRREFFPWYGHHAWKFIIGLCAISGLPLFLTPTWLSTLDLVLLFATFYAMQVHERKLCERCIAFWPINPEAEVKKHALALHQFHAVFERVFVSKRSYLTVLVAIVVLTIGTYFLPQWGSDLWGMLLNWLVIPWLFFVSYQHKKLQPWCPQCRRDDGGESFSPDPVPDPSVKADR